MKLPMHGFQSLLIHMRVNLRRRNIRVASISWMIRRSAPLLSKCVAKLCRKQMRVNVRFQSRVSRALFHDLPDAHRG